MPIENGRPVSLTGDEYEALVDELITLHETTPDLEIPIEHRREAIVLASMEAEAVEAGRATRVLMREGLHDATAVHIRKALEFGVTAQWIAATPNGVDAFFAESERNTRALYGEAKRTRQVMPDDIAAQYEKDPEAVPNEAKVIRWFTQVADTFGRDNGIYLQYRVLCGHCHVSVSSSLAQHLREDDTSTSGLRLQTTGGQRHDEWLYTLGIALLWGASAVDERTVKRPRSAKLADIAERLGVSPQLTPGGSIGAISE